MTTEAATIFIVDDDEAIRDSLSRALGKRGYEVETYGSATEFLDSFDPARRGCLILDYGMPGMTGLELQERLAEFHAAVPIIFITGHGGVPESVQAMKAGAIDFLEKPFRQEILLERIGTALEEDARTRQEVNKATAARRKFDTLTAREKEIVYLMVSDPSKTSSKEIARQLDISPRTADHHRARILEKMDIGSVAELVDLALTTKLFAGKV